MKVNSELKEIFKPLCKYISDVSSDKGLTVGEDVTIFVKTPHIFYNKVVVYLQSGSKLEEITEELEVGKYLEMKAIKTMMAQAYMNYFVHYHQGFSYPFYSIRITASIPSSNLVTVTGSDSPDPKDANGIQIRK